MVQCLRQLIGWAFDQQGEMTVYEHLIILRDVDEHVFDIGDREAIGRVRHGLMPLLLEFQFPADLHLVGNEYDLIVEYGVTGGYGEQE